MRLKINLANAARFLKAGAARLMPTKPPWSNPARPRRSASARWRAQLQRPKVGCRNRSDMPPSHYPNHDQESRSLELMLLVGITSIYAPTLASISMRSKIIFDALHEIASKRAMQAQKRASTLLTQNGSGEAR